MFSCICMLKQTSIHFFIDPTQNHKKSKKIQFEFFIDKSLKNHNSENICSREFWLEFKFHPLPNRPYLVLQLLKRKNRVAAEISELTAYHNVLWNHFRKEAVFLTYDAAPWSNWLQCLYCNICCFVSSMVAIFLRFTLHDMPPNSCTTFPAFFVYPWRFHHIKIVWINWSNKNNNWQWIDKEQSPNLTRWQWLMNYYVTLLTL